MELDALVVIGGDGTLAIALSSQKWASRSSASPDDRQRHRRHGDCLGSIPPWRRDRRDRPLHTTAEAHRRIMFVEVMGRYAGGSRSRGGGRGADAILIPEIPFDIPTLAKRLMERDNWGAKFSIVVVAEGAFPKGGTHTFIEAAHDAHAEASGRRRPGQCGACQGNRQANALGGARSSTEGRRANQLRSRAGDALRGQGRGMIREGEFDVMVASRRRPCPRRSRRSWGRRRLSARLRPVAGGQGAGSGLRRLAHFYFPSSSASFLFCASSICLTWPSVSR